MAKVITSLPDLNISTTISGIDEIKKDLKSQEQKCIDSTNEYIAHIKELESNLISQMCQDRDFIDDMYKKQSARYELLISEQKRLIDIVHAYSELFTDCVTKSIKEQYIIERKLISIEYNIKKAEISTSRKFMYIIIILVVQFILFMVFTLQF